MTTCRMCREYAPDKESVRFGLRHYAHWQCFYNKHGANGWKTLSKFQAGRTPLWLMRNHPEIRHELSERGL